MNLQTVFCPNMDCPARGKIECGNIHPHSQIEKRCRCDVCDTTFSITKGAIFYRLKTDPNIVMLVIVFSLCLLFRGKIIVQQHEGCIMVESQLGKGATFRIYLPALMVETAVKPESLAM